MEIIAIIAVIVLIWSSVIYALSNDLEQAIYLLILWTAIKIEMIWNEILNILDK